jgi:hypothetical protein
VHPARKQQQAASETDRWRQKRILRSLTMMKMINQSGKRKRR